MKDKGIEKCICKGPEVAKSEAHLRNRREASPTRKQERGFYKKMLRDVERGRIMKGHTKNYFNFNPNVNTTHWRIIRKAEA